MPLPARSWRAVSLSALLCCRGVALAMVLLSGACTAAPHGAVVRAMPDSFAPLVARVLPAVVNIAVTETVSGSEALNDLPPELRDTPLGRALRRRLREHAEQVMGTASGFIIDPTGIVVTNDHVVSHANRIMVSLADGKRVQAQVLGADDLTDVAVIKVPAPTPFPHVTWGDSRKVAVGDWVLAAGNPFGLGGSVTAGIISADGRDLGNGPFDNFLQLDAPINPGNSGGPIFDLDGEVIGVSTAIVTPSGGSVGIGFAIPSESVRPIVAELLAHGSVARGWLGVAVGDAASGGAAVKGVERAGPAMRAGVRTGDIVLAVDSEHIETARGLIRAIAGKAPGNTVHLTVRRQGRELDLSVTIGRRPPEPAG
jgi:serine protease Do